MTSALGVAWPSIHRSAYCAPNNAPDDDGGRQEHRDHAEPPLSAPLSAEDATLAKRIREGDSEAFRTVMHAYYDPAKRTAFQILGSHDAATDIVQQLFSVLWQRRSSFHPTRSIRSYLLMAARNNALKDIRQQRIRDRHHDAMRHTATIDEHASVTNDMTAIDNQATVATILATLSDRRRHAVQLRYLEQLSYAEIGQVLGISAGAAEQLVIRALDALRQASSQE